MALSTSMRHAWPNWRWLVAVSLVAAAGSARAQHDVTGSWYGVVPLRGGEVTLRVDLAQSDSGIAAIMDVVESRLIRFPVPEAKLEHGELRLRVPPGWGLAMFRDIGLAENEQVIEFNGTATGTSIRGALRLAHATLPLTLLRRAPSRSVRGEHLTFNNGDVTLAGTLYLPVGDGPFAAVVFTHGSGDRTRDAYASEAQQLAAAGIAALVYDKRGAGESVGANWTVATFDELASDAEAAVRMLRARRDIDARKIGMFGLSQGTWLIGMVAAHVRDLGFLVFVSGSGIPVWEQEIFRTGSMMRAAGYSPADIAEAQAYQRTKFAVARTGLGWHALDSLSKALRQRPAKWFEDYAQEYSTLTSARFWWLAAFHHDPRPILEHLTIPVLGLFGENDLSFPTSTVVANMSASFARSGNRDVTLTVFPNAEHQLMVPQPYNGRPLRRVVTPDYMPMLVGWIARQAGVRQN
jgi:pimeloyl-ACP methyl ester carboxylesterase